MQYVLKWMSGCAHEQVFLDLRVTPLRSQRQGAQQEECITETFNKSLHGPTKATCVPQHTLLFHVSAVSVYALN